MKVNGAWDKKFCHELSMASLTQPRVLPDPKKADSRHELICFSWESDKLTFSFLLLFFFFQLTPERNGTVPGSFRRQPRRGSWTSRNGSRETLAGTSSRFRSLYNSPSQLAWTSPRPEDEWKKRRKIKSISSTFRPLPASDIKIR